MLAACSALAQGGADDAASDTAASSAKPTPVPASHEDLRALEKRVKALESKEQRAEAEPPPVAEEVTKLQMELQLPEMLGPMFTGLGPGVSKVYFSKTPLSVGGFGEVQYSSEDNGPRATNVTRLNPYLGYRFTKNIIFNSGFSFQNGGAVGADSGAARVEFAYLDFLFREDAGETGLRVGNILVPFGITNLRFEPNLFLPMNRMRSEVSIVPSTWHENGLLGFWKGGNLGVQIGILNGGNASSYEAGSWIRAGRQGGSNAKAEDAAWVLRVEALDDGSSLGTSFYMGNSAQGIGQLGDSQVTLGEIHGEWTRARFKAQAMYTEGTLSDAERVSSYRMQGIAKRVRGAYLVLSYDLLPRIGPLASEIIPTRPPAPGDRSLPFFVSAERTDLQADMPEGFPANPNLRSTIYTVGVNYKPHPQVVIKTDFAHERTDGGGSSRVVEAAIGFVF